MLRSSRRLMAWLLVLLCAGYLTATNTWANNRLFPIGNADVKALDEPADSSDVLEESQAFAFSEPAYQDGTLYFRWQIAPHYYLYGDRFPIQLAHNPNVRAGQVTLPHGTIKQDPAFGKVEAIHGDALISIPLSLVNPQLPTEVQIEIGWQGCAEGRVCYPPNRKRFQLSWPAVAAGEANPSPEIKEIPVTDSFGDVQAAAPSTSTATPLSEQDQIAAKLAKGNLGLTLLTFLGLGILLAFTPCVFPMIPILSGIIVGHQHITTRKAFALSLVYVLAMALTYTVAGVLAGLFGQNLQAIFQNPWIISVFSAVFILLALSMFGFYDLQVPSSLQSRLSTLSQQQHGGTVVGVAIMGVLSALIVGPCVAAPLAGALIYIGQTGNALLGGLALFALSLGMGLPLLLIGTSAGKWLPRAGAWMETTKLIFGLMLLGVAINLVERIIPHAAGLALWATLSIMSAVYLGAFAPLSSTSHGWHKFAKGLGLLLFIYGVLLAVGASTGNERASLTQPLKGLSLSADTNASSDLVFQTVTTNAQLDQALQAAKGKAVMVDFYADWCVSCKEMEAYTFPDAAVKTALQGVNLIKVDVTDYNAQAKALLSRFKLVGPPATLFFNRSGQERSEFRLVGFLAAAEFAAHVRKALN